MQVSWWRYAWACNGCARSPTRPVHPRSREQLRLDGTLRRLHGGRKCPLQQKTWTSRPEQHEGARAGWEAGGGAAEGGGGRQLGLPGQVDKPACHVVVRISIWASYPLKMSIFQTIFFYMKKLKICDTVSVQGLAGQAAVGGGQPSRWPPARNTQEGAAQVDKVDSRIAPQFPRRFTFPKGETVTFTCQRENVTLTFSGTMRRLTSLEPEHVTAAKKYICEGKNTFVKEEIHLRWKRSSNNENLYKFKSATIMFAIKVQKESQWPLFHQLRF